MIFFSDLAPDPTWLFLCEYISFCCFSISNSYKRERNNDNATSLFLNWLLSCWQNILIPVGMMIMMIMIMMMVLIMMMIDDDDDDVNDDDDDDNDDDNNDDNDEW